MKLHRLFMGITLFFLTMISPCFADEAETELLNEVTTLLKQHDAAFAAQDIQGVLKTYISGPQIFLMGTGPGEIYRGTEGVRGHTTSFSPNLKKGPWGSPTIGSVPVPWMIMPGLPPSTRLRARERMR